MSNRFWNLNRRLSAGDIGVLTKLGVKTGDTLCEEKLSCKFSGYDVPAPCYTMAIITQKGDESKVANGLHRLLEEDLTLGFEVNNAQRSGGTALRRYCG